MIEKIWAFICRHKLFENGDFVVLGVSGGADSMAMLYVLNSLKDRLDLRLHVAHLNHMLRGAEAREDADFVRSVSLSMGIPCNVGARDVPALISQEKLSVEEAARKARYAFLRKTAHEVGADKIAVAHNADDQAETLLIHLLHGTGLEGLAGMKPSSEGIVRPLLGVGRSEIEAFCSASGIKFRSDSTNEDMIFLRNRIRHHLIPVLGEYNQNIVETLSRTAEIIRAENDYIEKETVFAFENTAQVAEEGIGISSENYNRLEVALQRRLVRQVFNILAGREDSLPFCHVEEVREFITSGQTGKVLELPKNIFVEKTYSGALFSAAKDIYDPIRRDEKWKGCSVVMVPGITDLPAVNAEIAAAVFPVGEVKDRIFAASPMEAYMDWDKLELPLQVRSRREGDVFHPLGSTGSKKLKDFLIDEKVPKKERGYVPVLQDAKGIIWVAGFRMADRVKVTGSTRKVLHLHISRNRE